MGYHAQNINTSQKLLMSNFEYCLSQVAPNGSSLYYSCLSLAKEKKEAVVALAAYSNTIHSIGEKYKEADVAKIKLAWWQNELQNLANKKPQHPISITLLPYIDKFNLSITALLAVVEAAQLSISVSVYQTPKELQQHYQHTGGIITALQARVCNNGEFDAKLEKFAHYLGISLEIVRHIYDFKFHLQRQHLYLPLSQLEENNVVTQDIFNKPSKINLQNIFNAQAKSAYDFHKQALQILPKEHFSGQKSLRRFAKLQLKLLDTMQQDGFRMLQHQLRLSPIYKFLLTRFSR
ncbi:MAG: hypothetical protein COB50_05230 [Thiotrichales bacterium]|nr:MAG: hypothetical protein COB50_05230 [Thiotrichales bacterium]